MRAEEDEEALLLRDEERKNGKASGRASREEPWLEIHAHSNRCYTVQYPFLPNSPNPQYLGL